MFWFKIYLANKGEFISEIKKFGTWIKIVVFKLYRLLCSYFLLYSLAQNHLTEVPSLKLLYALSSLIFHQLNSNFAIIKICYLTARAYVGTYYLTSLSSVRIVVELKGAKRTRLPQRGFERSRKLNIHAV